MIKDSLIPAKGQEMRHKHGTAKRGVSRLRFSAVWRGSKYEIDAAIKTAASVLKDELKYVFHLKGIT